MKFVELDLDPALVKAVDEIGFEACTPIQSETLPHALAGSDVAGQAQTGTGKTAAFLLALINRLVRSERAKQVREREMAFRTPNGSEDGAGPDEATEANPTVNSDEPQEVSADDAQPQEDSGGDTEPNSDDDDAPKVHRRPSVLTRPQAIILAPTRELAIQIHADALALGKHTNLRFGVVFGGTGYNSQREMVLDGLDVLIGTPGRLIDYFKQRLFDFRAVEVVVLDEADRMFDLGFIKDIRFVLRRMPPPEKRLNMLFSATLSYRVMELAYEHMNDPRVIDVSPEQKTVDAVTQTLYHVSKEEKIPLLLGLMQASVPPRAIVFVNTKGGAERVLRYLTGNGYSAGLLSGDVPQKKRMRLLEQLQSGDLKILVATDVAARGLHIPDVTHVYNFDLPQDAEDYVHRIGRTARAGASGIAVSFACEEFVFSLQDIEDYIAQVIPTEQVTDELLIVPKPPGPRPERLERRPKGGKGHERGDGAKRKRRPRRRTRPRTEGEEGASSSESAASAAPTAAEPS